MKNVGIMLQIVYTVSNQRFIKLMTKYWEMRPWVVTGLMLLSRGNSSGLESFNVTAKRTNADQSIALTIN